MTLVRPLPINTVCDEIERMEAAMLRLERDCTGHCVGEVLGHRLKPLAKRLEDLCRPDKGHLQGGAVAKEFKDAA